ncbi:MAG: response regulator [Proteobacteria bacterium]|nr:response regulator [Pseudomonadota bacterium]
MSDDTNPVRHSVLCVDDEINILNSLKRLLRKENYTLLTASSGKEGLDILEKNDVHLVMSDQRMPEMSGTEFLAEIKEKYPDVIRIILTGYTEVDAMTESINRGHIYKFFLKPWNDENLRLEISKALEQYDLIKANEELTRTIIRQNEELKHMNDKLEEKVRHRTQELVIRNQALELSQAILENIPVPILGVSQENNIVLVNNRVGEISWGTSGTIVIGESLNDYANPYLVSQVQSVLRDNSGRRVKHYSISDKNYSIDISPLPTPFLGQGVILTLIKES